MPRAPFFVLLLVTFCLLCPPPALSEAMVWDETYNPAKIFKAKQNINIRSQPSNGSRVLQVMKHGQTATVPALVKGWYKVVLPDGTTGYVYKRFLEHVPGAQPAPAPEPAADSTKAAEPEVSAPTPAARPKATTQQPAPKPEAPAKATTDAPQSKPAREKPAQKAKAPAPTVQTGKQGAGGSDASVPQPAIHVPKDPAHSASTGVDCVRIKFKNNALTGTAERTEQQGGHDCYEVNLEKSQWMEVWLNSPEDAAKFEIFSPTGNTLCSREVHWLGRSEQAGEYIIFVGQNAGSGPYTLKVQVK